MSVSVILASKGNAVETIGPAVTLAATTKILSEKRIGAVVVVDTAGGIIGMLSERDIVRAFAKAGAAALDATVADYMTHKVVTGTPAEPINDIMERMTRGKFRHVPIVEGGRLVGIVSIGDVVKHRLADIEAEASAMRDYIATA